MGAEDIGTAPKKEKAKNGGFGEVERIGHVYISSIVGLVSVELKSIDPD